MSCQLSVVSTRHGANSTSCQQQQQQKTFQHSAASKRQPAPCQYDVVSKRHRASSTPCQDGAMPRQRCVKTTPCQHDTVSRQHRIRNDVVRTRHLANSMSGRGDTVSRHAVPIRHRVKATPSQDGAVSRRCRANTAPCQVGIAP